jgi:hypothetical protein
VSVDIKCVIEGHLVSNFNKVQERGGSKSDCFAGEWRPKAKTGSALVPLDHLPRVANLVKCFEDEDVEPDANVGGYHVHEAEAGDGLVTPELHLERRKEKACIFAHFAHFAILHFIWQFTPAAGRVIGFFPGTICIRRAFPQFLRANLILQLGSSITRWPPKKGSCTHVRVACVETEFQDKDVSQPLGG